VPTESLYWIEQPEQIEVLNSPVRQEIVDSVAVRGPCSVAELAEELGVPADSLYYHVRKLVRAGLLIEHGTRKTDRREEAIYKLPADKIRLRYNLDDPVNMHLISRTVASMLRVTERSFTEGTTSDEAVIEGPLRNLWAGRYKVWLTEDELHEVNQLILRLRELGGRPKRANAQQLCALT